MDLYKHSPYLPPFAIPPQNVAGVSSPSGPMATNSFLYILSLGDNGWWQRFSDIVHIDGKNALLAFSPRQKLVGSTNGRSLLALKQKWSDFEPWMDTNICRRACTSAEPDWNSHIHKKLTANDDSGPGRPVVLLCVSVWTISGTICFANKQLLCGRNNL